MSAFCVWTPSYEVGATLAVARECPFDTSSGGRKGRPYKYSIGIHPYERARYRFSHRLPASTLPGSRAANASALRQSSGVSTLLINTQPVS